VPDGYAEHYEEQEHGVGYPGRCGEGLLDRQCICWPPLIDSVDPVTKPASSPHRNITPRAISLA
jgi:hypothetical protein